MRGIELINPGARCPDWFGAGRGAAMLVAGGKRIR
jgi:hypothetical protein